MSYNGCAESSLIKRQGLEVADIFRDFGSEYARNHPVSSEQFHVMNQVVTCRTSALGGHKEECNACGHHQISYNSCRNRHCPKCQTMTKERWIKSRTSELLPVTYFHQVFTLPHELNPLILCNMKPLLDLLFASVNGAIKAFTSDPQWRLEGEAGFIGVLHTWTQTMLDHFHLHCLVPGGVLSDGRKKWTPSRKNFLFKTSSIVKEFKNRYMAGLMELNKKGQLKFPGKASKYGTKTGFQRLLQTIKRKKWSGYIKPPFSGPEKVLEYLGRYTHRVAISNYRIKRFENGNVIITWKDRANNNKTREMKLSPEEFIRRFLLHTLPRGFRKIRYFGFLSSRYKTENIKAIRNLNGMEDIPVNTEELSTEEMMLQLTGKDIRACPVCNKGRLRKRWEILPEEFKYICSGKAKIPWNSS